MPLVGLPKCWPNASAASKAFICWKKFGSPEAIWELEVVDFPCSVTMNAHHESLHERVQQASELALAQG